MPASTAKLDLDGTWQAESLRLTLFIAAPIPSDQLLLNVVGLTAEDVTRRSQMGLRQESRDLGIGRLYANEQPGRFDLILGDRTDPSTSQAFGFPRLFSAGGLAEALGTFNPLSIAACEAVQAITRIGYGVIAIKTASDLPDAARVLKDHVPSLPIDPATDTDIFWQVNRPTVAKSFDGRINRLVKWQTVQQQLVRVIIPGPAIPIPSGAPGMCFTRLETDANTAHADISSRLDAAAVGIFEELWEVTSTMLARKD